MGTHEREPYSGIEKSVVIGIDVGTTFSGVSYALLEPGKVPRIQPVTRFSGQKEDKGKSKVRSAVCYDQDGNFIAAGPETDPEVNPVLSGIEDARRAEWFKLHLCLAADKRSRLEKSWPYPELAKDSGENDVERVWGGKVEGSKGTRGEGNENKEEALWSTQSREVVERQLLNKRKIPRPVTDDFKTPDRVFTDFLQYLFESAKEYITETERNLDPTFTWSSIERNTYFVLTHPNEWGRKQQSQMRDAAIAADLVSRSTVADRITFVTEGEASLHFCLDKNPELHQEGVGLLVVDCGGGSIGLSAYSQTKQGDFKEIGPPDCLLQGSLLVTSRARDYFKERFKDSKFGSDAGVEVMARAFDRPEGIKCMFRCSDRPYFVKFGGLRDNDQKYGICGGKFKVEGTQMAKFFEPAVENIIAGIENQCGNTKDGISIKYVLLFGGFGRSQYLYAKLSDHFNGSGMVILRPDMTHLNKAVADGAVSWFLDHHVSTHSYEVKAGYLLDPDHLDRENTQVTQAEGESYISGIFSTVLEMDSEIWEETQFRQAREFIPIQQCPAWTTFNTPANRGQAADANQVQLPQAPVSEVGRFNHLLVEVAELARTLNALIEQASSLMEDSLSYGEPPISSKKSEDVLNKLIDSVGPWLCNDLRSKLKESRTEPDPLITQIALQAGLVNACNHIINNGVFPSDGATLSRIHSNRVEAAQAHVNAWKGRTYTTTSQRESWEIHWKYLAGRVFKLITEIGRILESGDVLLPRYNVLEEIVKGTPKLHKVVSEDVTLAMEPVIYTIPCDAASRMEDTGGDGFETRHLTQDTAICTLEVGPQCKKRKESGVREDAYLELQKVINEDVVSRMELNAYTIPYEAEFDSSRMEDVDGEEIETGSNTVVCTMKITEPDPLITPIALEPGLVNGCSCVMHNGIAHFDGATLSRTHGDMVKPGQADFGAWKAQLHTTPQSESWKINFAGDVNVTVDVVEHELPQKNLRMKKGRSSATIEDIGVVDSTKSHKSILMELGRKILSRPTYVSPISPLTIPFKLYT